MAKNKLSEKEYIVKNLTFAGKGRYDAECAKNVMAQLFTNHTGTFFNWKGKNGYTTFEDCILQDAVCLAVKRLRPLMDSIDTSYRIKDWFKSKEFVNHEQRL